MFSCWAPPNKTRAPVDPSCVDQVLENHWVKVLAQSNIRISSYRRFKISAYGKHAKNKYSINCRRLWPCLHLTYITKRRNFILVRIKFIPDQFTQIYRQKHILRGQFWVSHCRLNIRPLCVTKTCNFFHECNKKLVITTFNAIKFAQVGWIITVLKPVHFMKHKNQQRSEEKNIHFTAVL